MLNKRAITPAVSHFNSNIPLTQCIFAKKNRANKWSKYWNKCITFFSLFYHSLLGLLYRRVLMYLVLYPYWTTFPDQRQYPIVRISSVTGASLAYYTHSLVFFACLICPLSQLGRITYLLSWCKSWFCDGAGFALCTHFSYVSSDFAT